MAIEATVAFVGGAQCAKCGERATRYCKGCGRWICDADEVFGAAVRRGKAVPIGCATCKPRQIAP